MRVVRGNGGQATVFTHSDVGKVELIVRDDEGESIVYLTPQRAKKLAEFLSAAADRADVPLQKDHLEQ